MTFTFNDTDRLLIAAGLLVPGQEITRFLKAIKQKEKRLGNPAPLYMWVAENPSNSNPHIHLLTDLQIPYSNFRSYAEWAEQVWGHGWVNMKRIRDPHASGRYLLKSVQYAMKGTRQGQGTITGNRYSMSQALRTKETIYDLSVPSHLFRSVQRSTISSLKSGTLSDTLGGYATPYGVHLHHHDPQKALDLAKRLSLRDTLQSAIPSLRLVSGPS